MTPPHYTTESYREDVAAAISAADIGGPGSTLDLDAATDNVMALGHTMSPTRAEVIAALEEERLKRCCYVGPKCDCKFIDRFRPPTSEMTGCAELRAAMWVLTDGRYSGGVA